MIKNETHALFTPDPPHSINNEQPFSIHVFMNIRACVIDK